jgi:hypothetical protein
MNYENGLYIGKVAEFFVQEINGNHIMAIVITVTVILFLAYSIIYPVGQSAIIHYLKDRRGLRNALKKGRFNFFPMFEYGALGMITSPTTFFLALFRILIVGNIFNPRVLILMNLWRISIVTINTLKAYTRYCITIENLPLYEALKRSLEIAKNNLSLSRKYMRMQTVLLFNFSINLLLLVGIPFLLIYFSLSRGLIVYPIVKIIIYIIFFLLTVFSAYMSSFIRAFFAYYRYKLYASVTRDEDKVPSTK